MLLPLLVIASGLGLGFLGWLYGRLAGRERDLALGVRGLAEGIDEARRALEGRLEAAALEAERSAEAHAATLGSLQAEFDRTKPAAQAVEARVQSLSADLRTLGEQVKALPRPVDTQAATAELGQAMRGLLNRLEALEKRMAAVEVVPASRSTYSVNPPARAGSTASMRPAAAPAATAPAATAPATTPTGAAGPVQGSGAAMSAAPAAPSPTVPAPPVPPVPGAAPAPAPAPEPATEADAGDGEGGAGWIFLVLALLLLLALIANTCSA